MRPRHGSLWLLACVTLLLVRSNARSESDVDRNCEFKDPSALLPTGSHQGKFFGMTNFTDKSPAKMDQTLIVNGTFSIDVDKNGTIQRAEGNLEYSLGGTTLINKTVALGLGARGNATLKLSSGGRSASFALGGPLNLNVLGVAAAPNAKTNRSGSASGDVEVWFEPGPTDCGDLSGTFHATFIDQTTNSLANKGYGVDQRAHTWHVAGSKPPAQEVVDFRKRVDEAVNFRTDSGGRQIVKQKMQQLADEIRDKHGNDKLGQCLHKLWLEGAHKIFSKWIDEDVPRLKGYSDDLPGLTRLVNQILVADATMVSLGLDGCSVGLHQKVWNAIVVAYKNALSRAYRDEALADLLALEKGASIMGNVSPELHDEIWAMIKGIAEKYVKESLEALRRYKQAAKKPGGAKPTNCNAEQQAAIRRALFVAKQAELLGVDASALLQAITDLLATVTFKDIQECQYQQRQKNTEKYRPGPAGGGGT